MSFIEFENGMRIETPDTVKPDAEGKLRFASGTITLRGQTYICRDVEIDLGKGEMSYPAGADRTTWLVGSPKGIKRPDDPQTA